MNASELVNLTVRILEALAWPITVVVLVIILRTQISNLALNLSKLKYKDLELEFARKLDDAERNAESVNLQTESKETTQTDKEFEALQLAALQLPRAAVIQAWLGVELTVNEVSKSLNLAPTMRDNRVVELLARERRLSPAMMSLYRELRALRNQAAHAADFSVTTQDALRYATLALRLKEELRKTVTRPDN